MSNAIKILPHYTYNDYVQWKGQWELIDGIPYAMSPLPIPKHQIIATKLSGEFFIQFKNCSKCIASQPMDYRVADDTILQPDMLVIYREVTKNYLDFPPELVAEVLSPSTALKDRHSKYGIYESQGIKYYIIVAPDTEEVEVYELENGHYQLKQRGKNFIYEFFLTECTARIDFKEIW